MTKPHTPARIATCTRRRSVGRAGTRSFARASPTNCPCGPAPAPRWRCSSQEILHAHFTLASGHAREGPCSPTGRSRPRQNTRRGQLTQLATRMGRNLPAPSTSHLLVRLSCRHNVWSRMQFYSRVIPRPHLLRTPCPPALPGEARAYGPEPTTYYPHGHRMCTGAGLAQRDTPTAVCMEITHLPAQPPNHTRNALYRRNCL